jgi:predicted nucleic acid-binding protein
VEVILDTNAVSALFAGVPALGEILATDDRHHLPVIVIGEYRYGLMRSRDRRRLSRLLDLLIRESLVLPVVEETTTHYARIREELRRAVRPIPENDVWIAALARQHGQSIVTRDDHFDLVAELNRLSW